MAMVIWEARSILVCFDPKKSKFGQYNRLTAGVNDIIQIDDAARSHQPLIPEPRVTPHFFRYDVCAVRCPP